MTCGQGVGARRQLAINSGVHTGLDGRQKMLGARPGRGRGGDQALSARKEDARGFRYG
jgi:hypothetical protein